MKIVLAIILLAYLSKSYYVWKLREKRDNINLTTKSGKLPGDED